MSYQPVTVVSPYLGNAATGSGATSADSEYQQHLIEELRSDVTELRVQLEREKQRRVLLEQSYSYYNSIVQAAAQQSVAAINVSGSGIDTPTAAAVTANPLISPPQSRHSSTEESQDSPNSSVSLQQWRSTAIWS